MKRWIVRLVAALAVALSMCVASAPEAAAQTRRWFIGNTQLVTGAGSPEGAVTSPVGSIYMQTNGTAGSTFWVKESGVGNTGWRVIGIGAPADATYIVQTANGTLTAEQALSALSTALLLNTTGTGVLSAYGGTSCTNQFVRSLSVVAAATCESVSLTGDVSGDLPYSSLAQGQALSVLGVTGNAIADNASIVAGTDHQVLRRSGTAVTFGAVNLAQAAAVTGALLAANGGTGQSSYAVGDLLYADTTTTLAKRAAVAAGSYLRSAGTSTAPVWSTLILPNAATANRLAYATSTNTYGESVNLTFDGTTLTALAATGAVASSRFVFPATPNYSTDPNTEDQYKEGTWTPALTFDAAVSIVYSAQAGNYVKNNQAVQFTLRITLTDSGTSTGQAKITGLPFASITGTAGPAPLICTYYTGMAAISSGVMGYVVANSTEINLTMAGAAAITNLNHTNFTDSSDLLCGGEYRAAQ